jgi:adenylate cyclase
VSAGQVERRLAAIFAADVEGYSRLMSLDEVATLRALTAHRAVMDGLIAQHRGRIVNTAGDSVLAEFPSVVGAVECAVEVQQAIAAVSAAEPEDRRMRFRIGINLGDVLLKGGDLFGDGVNVAARLQALAEPGGICVSGTVRDHVGRKLAASFADLGEHAVKNIAEPVRVYRVGPINGAAPVTPASLPLPDKPSIAVLPFTNMSGDPEQECFSDGMSEDIITALSKLRWFFVIARNSTFSYKGKALDVRRVARELGVRYVLEGSVRKAGSRLRITAQLIDAPTGNHVWAERYDRDLSDIFAVQDEITQHVVASIEPRLYAAENLRIETKPPESLDAWGCVVRSLRHLARITAEDTQQAGQLLRRALGLSPNYAKAHSLLAWAEITAVARGFSDMDAAVPIAQHHTHTALVLDDSDPWTHFSIAILKIMRSQYAEALASFRRAIDLNPNFAIAHGFMAGALAFSGDADAALETVNRAIRMSPQDPFNSFYLYYAAIAHFTREQYADGLTWLRTAMSERPNYLPAWRLLSAYYVCLGQLDEARAAISEVLRLNAKSSIKRDAHGYVVFAQPSHQQRYVAALRQAGLPEE